MTQKTNDTNLVVVEKYVIARYATPIEKDAQGRDATTFWGCAPSSVVQYMPHYIQTYDFICATYHRISTNM